MVRQAQAAVVLAESDDYPRIEVETADFVYLRLMKARAEIDTGYPMDELANWQARANAWAKAGLDVFVFFIDGAKERAPAAALAFLQSMAKDAPSP